MEDLIEKIIAFVTNRPRTLIRICGHGGSGKTSFAQALHQDLPEGLKKDEITTALQTDLQVLQDAKVQELRGISQLDLLKYLDLGMLEVEIHLGLKSSSFNPSQLDVSQLPNGYYRMLWLNDEGFLHNDKSFRVVNGELLFLGSP